MRFYRLAAILLQWQNTPVKGSLHLASRSTVKGVVPSDRKTLPGKDRTDATNPLARMQPHATSFKAGP
jgi:hypothetical protein